MQEIVFAKQGDNLIKQGLAWSSRTGGSLLKNDPAPPSEGMADNEGQYLQWICAASISCLSLTIISPSFLKWANILYA